MTDNTDDKETTATPVAAAASAAVSAVADSTDTIIELIERVPKAYIFAALLTGMLVGVALVMFMDESNNKKEILMIETDEDINGS